MEIKNNSLFWFKIKKNLDFSFNNIAFNRVLN